MVVCVMADSVLWEASRTLLTAAKNENRKVLSSTRSNWGASSNAVQTAFAANSWDEQSMSMPSNSKSITFTRINGIWGFFHSSCGSINYSRRKRTGFILLTINNTCMDMHQFMGFAQ